MTNAKFDAQKAAKEEVSEVEASSKPYCYVVNNKIVFANFEEVIERMADITKRPVANKNENWLKLDAGRNSWALNNTFLDDIEKNRYGRNDDTTRYFFNTPTVVRDLISFLG